MHDLLLKIVARPAAAIVGWRGQESLSREAFLARVDAWRALALRTPGRALALYLDDSLEFGAALLGAWQAGKTVWLSADTLPATCTALARSVDAFFGEFPAQYGPRQPDAGERCALDYVPLAPAFDALLVHTSGSTGAAQAIPKRLEQMMSEVATLEALFGDAIGQAAVLATVSHQHIYGLLFKVLWPLAAGRPIVARSINYPEQLAQELALRPCVLVASPAHLKRLPEHLDWAPAAASLRAVFSSGGPLALEVSLAAGAMLGRAPTEIYGSSETGGVAWRRQSGDAGAWQAMPGVEWRAAAGDQLLEVRSAHLADSAWLRLADRVAPQADGRFVLLGRSDRIVKIEEKRISLDAIEAALLATGFAVEARVIVGEDIPGQRQVLAAFVVLSAAGRGQLEEGGKRALNERLRALLAESVEAVALPRRWRYLDQMPANAQGKTTHAQLLALLGPALDTRPRMPVDRLLEQDAQRILYELTVPATLFYFDGHFRQTPVLPGVVQVDWAILYGRRHFTLGPSFCALQALKFQNVIRPGLPVRLELTHDAAKDSLAFRYFSDDGQHAAGRILFGP